MQIPHLGSSLNPTQIEFLKTFSKSCRHSIIAMLKNSQSGHPGGSLSCIDYLSLLYTFIISQNGEKIVISNGHISPGVYSLLAELGYIKKAEVIHGFRKFGSIFEGHITRHVNGVWYGTGPLGIGVSVAAAFAKGEKLKATAKAKSQKSPDSPEKVYALMGDGEAQEGQVHEMIHFAKQHNLDNLIIFVDYNKVQLTDSLAAINNIDIPKIFQAGHFEIIEVNGHDFQEMWQALSKAQNAKKPVAIIGNTIMGKGVDFMEAAGIEHKADWHGKAPKPEQADEALAQLSLSEDEKNLIKNFLPQIKWRPKPAEYPEKLSKIAVNPPAPNLYLPDQLTDCRSAYGTALLNLAKKNSQIVALTADLKGSVKTDFLAEALPEQYIEVGISEQHMVSMAGGLSLTGFIPFCSTFGAFMTSRAKDQARVNDINCTNVKMVATHCGLSVGEDGPTHQSIDDKGSFLGLLNTMILEPADPNQTDHIIRYIAEHFGNFYVRMGRHKFPNILKEDGSIFFDQNYIFEHGKCDRIREGENITIAASGPTVFEAIKAWEILKSKGIRAEIITISSSKKFDDTLWSSLNKTRKLITVEDHNPFCGFASQIALQLEKSAIKLKKFTTLGVTEYQLSGTAEELYKAAGINSEAILKACS